MSLKEHNTATYHRLIISEILNSLPSEEQRTGSCDVMTRKDYRHYLTAVKEDNCSNILIRSSSSMTNPKAIQNLLVTSRNISQSTQMNQVLAKVMNSDTNIRVTLTDIRLSMSISWMHRKTAPDSPSPSMSMSSCIHTTLHSLRRNEHIQMFSNECFTLQSQSDDIRGLETHLKAIP